MDDAAVNILLVDDVRENLIALEALLRQPGVQLFSATSAEQALEFMLLHDFALAVIDVQMPVVDGFELAKTMHHSARTRDIPILFVTAGVEAGFASRGYDSGAIDFMYKPLDSHTVQSKVKVFVDLYRQRAALKEQVLALQESERNQRTLLEELQQTKLELEKAMRLRDEFMSVVSHELRTPLNTMKLELYTRRLRLESGDIDAFTMPKLNAMVEKDERQLNRLVRLINDMTDVSRIRTGQLSMQFVRIDLVAVAQQVVGQLAAQAELAGSEIRLQAEACPALMADEYRIEQALINLLTNAIRHCDGKPIEVRVECVSDSVRAAVKDYGRGIGEEDRQRIFQQFERGAHERKGSGLGLGLFIANQIAVAHNGCITVTSSPGAGAEFALQLPQGNR